ncbi:MAG: pitrilysin family protein, partial [Mariprofundaceae bacterium]
MMKRIRMNVVLSICALLFWAGTADATAPIQEARLDNGLRVLLMEAHDVPMVVMRLTAPAGSRFDPAGKGGSASLLAGMLTDHTKKHDYRAWADMLDAEAIRLGGGADREGLNLSLTVLKEALESGVAALAEAALQPGWNKKRFEIMRKDSISAVTKSLEEPGVQASMLAASMLFADHPYGHRTGGDVETLRRIRMQDLKSVYARQFKPAGSILAVSGDVTMAEVLTLIKPAFAAWSGKPAVALQDIEPPAPVVGQSLHKDMPTRQALVQLLRLGPARHDDGFFAAMLMNHILGGGGFSSRLMTEVREKRGLVYGVYSYFVPLTVPGPFAITLQTRADQAGRAVGVVRDVLRDMATHGVTAKELKAAQDNLAGSFAHRMDSNAKRVGLMSMVGFYGLPLDYLQTWTNKVRAVRLADVQRQAQAY